MLVVTENSSFVSPHYISELDEDGLTLHEIAKSLGIDFKHAKEALEKNLNDYMTVEISTLVNRGFIGQAEIKSYALNTEDAKFFVAGYNNEIGKSYRRSNARKLFSKRSHSLSLVSILKLKKY